MGLNEEVKRGKTRINIGIFACEDKLSKTAMVHGVATNCNQKNLCHFLESSLTVKQLFWPRINKNKDDSDNF